MDAYQQANRFMRPPSSTAEPHFPPHHQQAPRQPGQWLSNQFQYNSSHSPSPQPPQWAPPPPHSDHLNPPQASACPPPPHHYSHQSQFPPPPPRPYLPPHPPPHSQVPQGYSQERGNPNWGPHQAYPVHNNEEDWAAKAKAWATAKTAMNNQDPQPQFSSVSRPEEQGQCNDQYPQTVYPHYSDMGTHSIPAPSYQQYSATASNRPSASHFQESASISPGPVSYVPDGHAHFTGRNGNVAGDSNNALPHQEAVRSPSVHQQEVPSSYSSVTGREQYADRNEHSYTSMPFPASSAQEGQHHTQSTLANQPYVYGSQSANHQPDLSNHPLDFAPRFNHDHDPHIHATYSHYDVGGSAREVDHVATMPSAHSWAPSIVPGYSSIPPVLPSGPQHDPSIGVPSPVPVHTVPPFGGFPGPGFQSSVPSSGTTPYGLGVGNALLAATPFPGDAYGISGVSERPKKAPVPNWLREEIIKKKAVMTSFQAQLKEEPPSIEDEGVDISSGKGDQGDSRSFESSRSTEEEDDDDEDYVEAARTAAINSEIKRILTEVLLKVTDELFDEIATKVISEDDLTVDVNRKSVMSNLKVSVSPSPPAVLTLKASTEVLIPVQAKDTNTETTGKSNSSSPVDVLGLSNYASDEDEEDQIESSTKSKSGTNSVRNPENTHDAIENGSSQVEKDGGEKNTEGAYNGTELIKSNNNHSIVSASMDARELGNVNANVVHSSEISGDKGISFDGKMLYGTNGPSTKDNFREKTIMKSEQLSRNTDVKKLRDDPSGKETRIKSDKNDLRESKRLSSGNDFKETDSSKIRLNEKGDEKRRRQDEKLTRKNQMDDRYISKHRAKEQGVRTEEKEKESDSRKRSTHHGAKEERKENERPHRTSAKEDANKKRERAKDEDDRSRKKLDSSKHKRRRSSSDSSQGKNSKDNPADQTNNSSDDASDDSRRRLHSRGHDHSPSPVRSRRRQVSRSPHSKHSQSRQSPYSSFETTRGRRSRSRSKSPVRRRR